MVNFYIYAKDTSGSTGHMPYYHTNGLKTLEEFKRDVEKIKQELLDAGEPPTESKIVYLHWGHLCYEVDEETTKRTYIEKACDVDFLTKPECIIKWFGENYDICGENNKIKLLYIITDGMVDSYSAETCFNLNGCINYEAVVFHAFNEELSQIDLSVAASFFKKRCMVYRNYELFDNVDISKVYDYDKINVDNFAVAKEDLRPYIKLKFINSSKYDALALQEINKLKKLRDRLFKELALRPQKSYDKLETKDRNVFLQEFVRTDWYKSLNCSVHDAKMDIEKSISTLINYIFSKRKSYSFNALRFNTKFYKPIKEEPIADVSFLPEQEIQFPDIILDDDKGIPVIIVTECNLLDKIIFHRTKESTQLSSASFDKFKTAMECPLLLMNDPDISESIGYFYTLNVYKQLLAHTRKTEPRTRRPFHGGLVLTNTDEFDKYNDFVLSATYFNFKKINYNVGLFYYVLWKNCENKEWMDKNVVEQFQKYTMRRISTTVCKIALSSLPLDPTINTSLLTALWYCVDLSSCIFKDDDVYFMQERLRMYSGVAHYMIEILKYFNYDLDLEGIEKRTDIIKHVKILKKIPRLKDKYYYLLKTIFKSVNGFLVSEIENPFNLYKLNYLELNHKRILPEYMIEKIVPLNGYVHMMNFEGDLSKPQAASCKFEICEKTFRPFFTIDKNKSFYTGLVKATRKIVINNDYDKDKIHITYEPVDSLEFDRILSVYNLFINCVRSSKKYPSLAEYVEYVSKKKKFEQDLVTIFPTNVYADVEEVYRSYQKVVKMVEVDKFIEMTKTYVNRFDRIKAEEVVEFENDNEIKEFISSEEVKANVIKKEKKEEERRRMRRRRRRVQNFE